MNLDLVDIEFNKKLLEQEYSGPGGVQEEIDKPSKEEYAVAKWLKKNVRTKRTKFLSHNVEYFTANKALDALMNSKFADGDNCLFPNRENAIEFLDLMLEHKFFHRAKKVPVYPEDLKGGKSKKTGIITTGEKEIGIVKKDSSIKDEKEKEKEKEKATADGENSHAEGYGSQAEEQAKEKRKRKIKLDMHPEQIFVDGSEAYVWIYDPVPIHYWIYGMALVLGAIVVCLFPLWPPILRKGVYYLSIAAAGFLVFILVLTIVRLIIFVIVWILSGGKLYFWIFPNLTEDVGFLASFWPLYESEYHVESGSSKSGKKSKKKKKEKDSDAEDETGDQQPLLEPEKIENIKENETGSIVTVSDSITKNDNNDEYEDYDDDIDDDINGDNNAKSKNINDNDEKSKKQDKDDIKTTSTIAEGKENTTPSESESEGSRSSTGKDFEIVDAPDLEITTSTSSPTNEAK